MTTSLQSTRTPEENVRIALGYSIIKGMPYYEKALADFESIIAERDALRERPQFTKPTAKEEPKL